VADDPSNAELARMITALSSHVDKIDGKVDGFLGVMTKVQAQADVDRAVSTAEFKRIDEKIGEVRAQAKDRMDAHDSYTRDQEQKGEFRSTILVAVLSVVGTLAVGAITIVFSLH
jgi:hypothetical protein